MDRSMLLRILSCGCFFLLLSPEILVTVLAQIHNEVRLVGGSNDAEGRVEIYHFPEWGTVCDDSWGVEESKVVCRQLGYERTDVAPETHARAAFGQGTGRIWLDDVTCTGSEIKLSLCSHRGWGVNDCSHSEDVGVRCVTAEAEVTDGFLRLVGGTTENEGRLEIYHDQKWGTVCDDSWDATDGDVACRQLGFPGIDALNSVFPAVAGFGPIWMDEVNCGGTELELSSCSHNGWGINDCTHPEDVGLRCMPFVEPSGSLRLSDGETENEGRIEIYYKGEWGTVCDNGWEMYDGEVACQQLGFPGAYTVDVSFGPGTGTIWLDAVQCLGTEQTLAECSHDGWGIHKCDHSTDAAVRCSRSPGDLPDGALRLMGGTTEYEGRVEILHIGEWGAVCDDNWDWPDAEVACRQLGYAGADMVYDQAHFGEGFGRIWLDDMQCTGSEMTLADCYSGGWGNENCGHSEDAGVRCSSEGDAGTVRLVNGPSESEGLLEIYHDYQWGTVCDGSFDSMDSKVVCKQLGFTRSASFFTALDKGYQVQDDTWPIWLDSVNCDGTEARLSYCNHNGWGVNDCSHSEDIGVQCSVKGAGLSGGAIAGIVIGSLVGVFCFYYCCCKGSKKKPPTQVFDTIPIDHSRVQGPLESGALTRDGNAQEPNPTQPTAPDASMPDLPPPSYDDIGNYTSYGPPGAEGVYPPTASAPYPPESSPYPPESSPYPPASAPYPPAASPPPYPPAASPPQSFAAASVTYPYFPSGDEGAVPSAPPAYPPS